MALKRVAEAISTEFEIGRLHGEISGLKDRMNSEMAGVKDRLGRLEDHAFPLRPLSPQRWTPRDYIVAGMAIAGVLAALAEKIGWLELFAYIPRLLAK